MPLSSNSQATKEPSWLGRQVVVTGGEGFIGSHLVRALLESGASVKLFSHYKPYRETGPLRDVWGRLGHVEGDLSDYQSVNDALEGCDTVFHLAALIGIPYSYRHPQAYTRVNVLGTQNVMHAAYKLGISSVVHTSTSEVYGTARYTPIDESHPLIPQSPYSASKIGADAIALSYFYSFELPVVIIRPFNCFGAGQSLRAVIPSVVAQCLSSSNDVRLGDLSPRRNFTYVSDTVRGFLLAAHNGNAVGEVINIGSEPHISVGELVERTLRILRVEKRVLQDEARIRPDRSEVRVLSCDSSKARTLLGWAPRIALDDGLRLVVERVRESPIDATSYAV